VIGTSALTQEQTARGPRADRIRLVCAQLLCGVGIASGVAVGGLLAERVSGTVQAAGFAQTAVVVGAGLVAMPLARLAALRGRRWSLSLGFGLAAVGAVIILVAVAMSQFWLLLAGMMFFGSGTATNLQSRYAATELVDTANQARAMSIVLWATTVGSVAGPNLSDPGSRLGIALGMNPLVGPYLFSVVAFALAMLVALTLRMGPRAATGSMRGEHRPRSAGALSALRVALGNRNAVFALVAIVGGQMMMTSVMVMTPVTMNHDGMSLELVGIVISVHIVGMYAASPFFGWLADRFGPRNVVLIGAALFAIAFALGAYNATAAQSQMAVIMVALGILGLGWSACIIGGSTLLTQSVGEAVKVPLQGVVDAMMNFGAAALAALAGGVLAFGGFLAVNVMAAIILLPLVALGIRAATARGGTRLQAAARDVDRVNEPAAGDLEAAVTPRR
jgi:MFS family permease